jgi:predicted ABC-class ATPase
MAKFPPSTFGNKSREVALRDFLTRTFAAEIRKISFSRATGKSGVISVLTPGQEILERTSCLVNEKYVELRFTVGLPAFGRRIAGQLAREIFSGQIPPLVKRSLFYQNLNSQKLDRHLKANEEADFLRAQLPAKKLVAFIANGSILPRLSGVDPRPLPPEKAVPFQSPPSLEVSFHLPYSGVVRGLGVPEGLTLIVGGGYHGKSTLLNALELGVYNHLPGDGRERVVTNSSAVKIRAEDGRRVEKVDISPFISHLPQGEDTTSFSSDLASGSTSQAANIMEALEMGSQVLLIDEDTSATNFMIRDHRMQELVSKDKEPITPFIDRVNELYQKKGVSTILVMGGCGDYFDAAQAVICLVEYHAHDVTTQARAIAEKYKLERKKETEKELGEIKKRVPLLSGFDPSRGKKEVKISPKGLHSISFGREQIDLGAIEQLVEISQTKAVGEAIYYATRYIDGQRTLREVIDLVMTEIEKKGLDVIGLWLSGEYSYFRKFELAAAINRLRSLRVKNVPL